MISKHKIFMSAGYMTVFAICLVTPLQAQDNSRDRPIENSNTRPDNESPIKAEPTETDPQRKDDTIFRPSEEVSEDYAVPFPADI